jgi:hypothetical protein
MQSRAGSFLRRYAGPSIALALSLALLCGCGGSDNAATTKSSATTAETTTQTPPAPSAEKKVLAYLKRRFGNTGWYPYIASVTVSGGSATVSTKLINHHKAHWNQKQAEAMCKAFLGSPLVHTAEVFYDSTVGGSTAYCSSS